AGKPAAAVRPLRPARPQRRRPAGAGRRGAGAFLPVVRAGAADRARLPAGRNPPPVRADARRLRHAGVLPGLTPSGASPKVRSAVLFFRIPPMSLPRRAACLALLLLLAGCASAGGHWVELAGTRYQVELAQDDATR